MKKFKVKKRYVVGFVLLVILVAIYGYNSFLSKQRFPVIKSCEQQFISSQNGTEMAECYEDAAIAQHNPSFCGQVGIGTWRQSDCIKAVLAAFPDEPAVYKKLRYPYLRAMFIYYRKNLPLEEYNPSYSIDEYFLDFIINKTNLSAKDLFICEEIDNPYVRSPCYNQIAIAEKDISICNKIPHITIKDDCYGSIAQETLDPAICGKIVDIMMRSYCHIGVAGQGQEASICNKVEITSLRKDCYSNIAGNKGSEFISKDYCEQDSDCVVKDVHNCCGYYPRCVNKNYTPNITEVEKSCQEQKALGSCGYLEITNCKCIENKCNSMQGDMVV